MNTKHFSVAALAGFTFAVVIGDIAGRTEYSLVSEPVSRYVNASLGWVTVVGLFCLGIGTALVAWRVRSRVLGVAAAATAVAAVFPADPPGNWSNPSLSDTIHGQSAMLAFAALALSALVVKEARILAWVAVGSTAFMVVTLVDVMTVRWLATGTIPTFFGLTERVALLAYVAWMIAAVLLSEPKGDRDAFPV